MSRRVDVQGVSVPRFFYGTAWKENETERLTRLALDAGFEAVDTANQRKHYFEEGAGRAVAAFLGETKTPRERLFLQTKFTYARGQDHRKPYDERAPFEAQVRASFASSLEHLRVSSIDSYVLHGPWGGEGLARQDHEVWRTMESLHDAGSVRLLGTSNTSREQLAALWSFGRVKPAFVQNRCYARTRWDADVRAFCRDHGILYQGFSLLTANKRETESGTVTAIAKRHGRTKSQVVFRFALQVGMVALTGTSSSEHMREDLAVFDFELDDAEVSAIEAV